MRDENRDQDLSLARLALDKPWPDIPDLDSKFISLWPEPHANYWPVECMINFIDHMLSQRPHTGWIIQMDIISRANGLASKGLRQGIQIQ